MTGQPFPWRPLVALSAATFVTVTAELLPAGLLPDMSADLAVSPSRIGLLVSAWAVTVALVSLPLVRLTARVPRRRLMTIALLVFALANLATALAPGYGAAAGSRILAAAAHALFWSVVIAYAAGVVVPEQTGRAVSVVLAGPTLASVVGLPLGTVVAGAFGWRVTFAAVAVLMLVAAAVLRLVLVNPTADDAAAVPTRRGWDASAPAVLAVAVAGAVVLVGHFTLFTYVSPLLTDRGGFGAGSVGPLLLVFGVAGAGGLALAGPLSDRAPRSALVLGSALFAASAASLAALGVAPVLSVVLLVVWGALIGLLPPVLQARVLRVASPEFRDTAGAVVVASLNVGVAGGAALGGLLVAGPGLAVLAPVAGATALVAVVGLAGATYRRA